MTTKAKGYNFSFRKVIRCIEDLANTLLAFAFPHLNLMVAACANTWPPAGFFESVMNIPPP
jgi:hypothetical protein